MQFKKTLNMQVIKVVWVILAHCRCLLYQTEQIRTRLWIFMNLKALFRSNFSSAPQTLQFTLLYLLRKFKTPPVDFLPSAYHALFHSHILYGLVLWGQAVETKKILLFLKKIVRLLCLAGKPDQCRPFPDCMFWPSSVNTWLGCACQGE